MVIWPSGSGLLSLATFAIAVPRKRPVIKIQIGKIDFMRELFSAWSGVLCWTAPRSRSSWVYVAALDVGKFPCQESTCRLPQLRVTSPPVAGKELGNRYTEGVIKLFCCYRVHQVTNPELQALMVAAFVALALYL